jgi:hypothetical protein
MRSMASLFGVGGMARGGVVPGVQGITGDNIPALLTKDEFVVSEGPSKKHRALLHAINKGGVAKHFATGGVAGGGSYGATSQVQYTPVYVTNYKDFNFGGNRAKDAMSSAAMGKMPGVGGDMGGGIGSMLGMMGGPIGVVTAGLTALGVGMSKTTELLNINGDRLATQGQKYRSMMESIIPGASIFNNFVDALQGVSGSMRQLKLDMRISETRIAAGASVRAANAGLNTERVQNETTASGMRAHSLGSNQIFNRATEHGQIQSEDFQTRQSARDNYVRAQRTETGARQNQAYHTRRAASLGGNVASLREDYNARRAQRETLQANDTNGDGLHRVRVAEALNKEREAQLRLQTRVNEAVAAEGQARAAGVAAEQATVAARRAALDIARADLDVLNRREQRMSGTAGRLGAMSRGSFRQAERSAARVARRGVERSSESDVQRAAQIDPRLIREQQDRLGERRAQRLVGRQGVGETHNADWQGGANLQNVREQQDTAAQTARDQADRIAVEGAQQVSVAFNEGLNRVFRLLQSGIEDAVARLETQAAMGSNSP